MGVSSGQCVSEVVPEHRILVCGRPHSDKKSARNEEALEKGPGDKRPRTIDELNQRLLATAQETQRMQEGFLESLERRWQLMENLSHGVVRSLEDLRAGLEVRSLHARRTQTDFLESLEHRWHLMENLSHGVARSLEELRAGLDVR